MKNIELYIEEDTIDRLDVYLAKKIDDISRNQIQKLINNGNILVNGSKKKSKYLLKLGDHIIVKIPKSKKRQIRPQDITLNIVYEDSDIAIINKAQGMIVHPTLKKSEDTLVNALLYHFKNLSDIGGDIRPGIVHRLDKDTSGLLIIAKNNFAHKELSDDFKTREIIREYILLARGIIEDNDGMIDKPIGRNPNNRLKRIVTDKNSREAITYYRVLERFENYTLVQARLETGRTHQIRVHFADTNHAIVGDAIYSNDNRFKSTNLLLHSIKIGFNHPRTKEYMEFSTDIPVSFKEIIEKIE